MYTNMYIIYLPSQINLITWRSHLPCFASMTKPLCFYTFPLLPWLYPPTYVTSLVRRANTLSPCMHSETPCLQEQAEDDTRERNNKRADLCGNKKYSCQTCSIDESTSEGILGQTGLAVNTSVRWLFISTVYGTGPSGWYWVIGEIIFSPDYKPGTRFWVRPPGKKIVGGKIRGGPHFFGFTGPR